MTRKPSCLYACSAPVLCSSTIRNTRGASAKAACVSAAVQAEALRVEGQRHVAAHAVDPIDSHRQFAVRDERHRPSLEFMEMASAASARIDQLLVRLKS